MMTSLLALPIELLQHIACYLPCSSVLKLMRVNRRLHSTCNDRLVYQFIAKNTLSHDYGATNRLHEVSSSIKRSNLSTSELAWPEGDLLLRNADLATTILVAYAVEQCVSAVCTTDDDWTLRLRKETTLYDITDWLPHMLALHHPVGWALEPGRFLRLQGELSVPIPSLVRPSLMNRVMPWSRAAIEDESLVAQERTADFINASFVLSYTTLQQIKMTRDPKGVIRLFEDFFYPVWLEGTHPASWGEEQNIISNTIRRLCDRVPDYGSFTNEFTLAQAMALLPAMIIDLTAQFPDPDQLDELPTPAKIPFHTFMNLPVVFHHAAEMVSTCHLREITTPTFLCGRWRGYYTDQRTSLHLRRPFDPPMRDIRITARSPTREQAARMKVKAIIDPQSRGVDSHGEFSLEGRVRENGLVHIVKRYILNPHWSWSWCGQMTPFGIIGVWGGRNDFGGYFWISKEEWS